MSEAKKNLALSRERAYDIILSPVITEKATFITDKNFVTFKVATSATKPEIRAAVELVFGVTVEAVNTVVVKGKRKLFRGRPGRRSDYKKAMVKLADGQAIDLTTGV